MIAAIVACLCVGWIGSARANSVTDWNETTVKYVAGVGVPPGRGGPVGFLDVALVQAAVHDAVQAIEHRYAPYAYEGTYTGSKDAAVKDAAVAAAAHRMLVLLYPARQGALDPLYNTYLTTHGLVANPGLAVGEASAAKLFTEHYKALYAETPVFIGHNEPGQWRPIPAPPGTPAAPTSMQFLTLAFTKPFVLDSVTQFRPPPPPPLNSSRYVHEYNEVKAVGSSTAYPGPNSAVSDFWNADPLQRWNGAIRGIMVNSDVGESARLFALANLSAADTLMGVFEAKYFYNFWRPVTAIRNDDGNPKTVSDANWSAYILNPPYPEYPSGMNGVAGAMTQTMRLFFGTDKISFSIPGPAPRNYSSFSQAADELIEVRILQGIHFRSAEEDGRRVGERTAHYAFHNILGTDKGHDEGVAADWVVDDEKK
jgi:hypothetical protein